MIQRITNIQGMGVFDGFEWDKHLLKDGRPLRFGDINILYGQNYTGKTTLSRILRALETRTLPKKYDHIRFSVICDGSLTISQDTLDKAVNLPVRVFNEDFVRDNLRFLSDPDGEIAPFAILGADNAAIQSSIDRLRAELGSDEEGKTSGLYGEYMRRARNASLAQGNLKSAKEQFTIGIGNAKILSDFLRAFNSGGQVFFVKPHKNSLPKRRKRAGNPFQPKPRRSKIREKRRIGIKKRFAGFAPNCPKSCKYKYEGKAKLAGFAPVPKPGGLPGTQLFRPENWDFPNLPVRSAEGKKKGNPNFSAIFKRPDRRGGFGRPGDGPENLPLAIRFEIC